MFRENLPLRLENIIVEFVIIDRTAAHESSSGSDGSLAEHERTACLAKGVGHHAVACDSIVLSKGTQIILSPYKSRVRVQCGQVRREHRGGPLSTIRAVTYKSIEESRTFYRLFD